MFSFPIANNLAKLFRKPVYFPELEIISDLQVLPELLEGKKIFKVTGSKAMLAFAMPIPKGWFVQLNCYSMAAEMRPLKFYLKFTDKNVTLDNVAKGGENIVRAEMFFQLPCDVEKILIEISDESDLFSLEISLNVISFLSFQWCQVKAFFKKNGISLQTSMQFVRRVASLFLGRQTYITRTKVVYAATDSDDNGLMEEIIQKSVAKKLNQLSYHPLFSVIMPVYNTPIAILQKAIDSVLAQHYPHWELCIADDASTVQEIRPLLEQYAQQDPRIKLVFLNQNGHICAASNAAISLATGEFIALLDHDDALSAKALLENAVLLNKHPDADMIYSDEDKITENDEYYGAFFKPDWSPDYFLSCMYTCHLGVYRTQIVKEIGGFREGFEGSQDYDLVLRFTEKTQRIFHIPKILYHWRAVAGSEASKAAEKPYAARAAFRAIEEALVRRGENGLVSVIPGTVGRFYVNYQLISQPLVSIIIPTRDGHDMLKACIDSIFEKTTYQNFEIIVIDNGSQDPRIKKLLTGYAGKYPAQFSSKLLDIPFNFSILNNEAVNIARGEVVLFLNNDTIVLTATWLEQMVGFAVRPSIGAVGALLLYQDGTIQHAGVVMGIGGVTGHSHRYFPRHSTGYFDRLAVPSNYAAVTGACLMMKKSDFLAVGGFEVRLKVAYNDVDLCLKLHAAGKYNVMLPDVKLYHLESKSRGADDTLEKQKIARYEREFLTEKWQPVIDNDPFYNPNLTREREDFTVA